MRSELMEKLEKALECEVTTVLPHKAFPILALNHRGETEETRLINEYTNAGLKFAHLKPLHSALLECVRALEKIDEDFGTDYADGNVMIAHAALEALAKACE